MRCRPSVLRLLAALFLLIQETAAQGVLRFTCNITGIDLTPSGPMPIRGSGNLQLVRSSLIYDLSIPLRVDLPVEAHFHGPAVDRNTPIISLVPYTVYAGGIRYTGTLDVPGQFLPDLRAGKWYINLHSPNYDNGVLSDYIHPVPESNVLAIGMVGVLLFACKKSDH